MEVRGLVALWPATAAGYAALTGRPPAQSESGAHTDAAEA